jgi:hypothetical protein
MDEDQLEKVLFSVSESETMPIRPSLDMVYIRNASVTQGGQGRRKGRPKEC